MDKVQRKLKYAIRTLKKWCSGHAKRVPDGVPNGVSKRTLRRHLGTLKRQNEGPADPRRTPFPELAGLSKSSEKWKYGVRNGSLATLNLDLHRPEFEGWEQESSSRDPCRAQSGQGRRGRAGEGRLGPKVPAGLRRLGPGCSTWDRDAGSYFLAEKRDSRPVILRNRGVFGAARNFLDPGSGGREFRFRKARFSPVKQGVFGKTLKCGRFDPESRP